MARELRLFLDSNVILSGFLSTKGAPKILLDLLSIQVPGLKGLTGQYNLDEIERNLRRRFPEILEIYSTYLPKLHLQVIEVPSYGEIAPLLKRMSPKDAPVLASARRGQADYLITGDRTGFPKEVLKPILRLTPSEFLSRVLPGFIEQASREE